MIELFTQFGFWPVLLILFLGIPAIINIISWCKNLWEKRTKFTKAAEERGRSQEKQEEAEEHRFLDGEARISALEKNVELLTQMVTQQKTMIERLTKSDMLDIKSWIKVQHERYMAQGWIDSQALDLLCSRHEVYKEEGGNSWADCIVSDLKKLPHTPPVTPAVPRDICNNPKDKD